MRFGFANAADDSGAMFWNDHPIDCVTRELTVRDLEGTWWLAAPHWPEAFRLQLVVNGKLPTATLTDESTGVPEAVRYFIANPKGAVLQFVRVGKGFAQWYRGRIVEGIIKGRFAHITNPNEYPDGGVPSPTNLPPVEKFVHHFTGWHQEAIDEGDRLRRVFTLLLDSNSPHFQFRATLRLDRGDAAFSPKAVGRFKVYSRTDAEASFKDDDYEDAWDELHNKKIDVTNPDQMLCTTVGDPDDPPDAPPIDACGFALGDCGGSRFEDLEYDLDVTLWDGTLLRFTRRLNPGTPEQRDQTYEGTVSGRSIRGTFHDPKFGTFKWRGLRSNLFTFGLQTRSDVSRSAWQRKTRCRLQHLMMGSSLQPMTPVSTKYGPVQAPFAIGQLAYYESRDDDAKNHPPTYTVRRFDLGFAIENPYDANSILRHVTGYVARPSGPVGAAGPQRVALVLNGHGLPAPEGLPALALRGSARRCLSANSDFWYGDAFARRGYTVIAVDVSHRPRTDRHTNSHGLYCDKLVGDDPDEGNPARPAVRHQGSGWDSDWEEDGERVWSALQALQVFSPNADVVVGLSMGGAVSAYCAALDPSIAVGLLSGSGGDVAVDGHYISHPCQEWSFADKREYIDTSDLHALIAPRGTIFQQVAKDYNYSFVHPIAQGKQIARRSRLAFATTDPSPFVHHIAVLPDQLQQHAFLAGDRDASGNKKGVTVPVRVQPAVAYDTSWQTDASLLRLPVIVQTKTQQLFIDPTVFDVVEALQ